MFLYLLPLRTLAYYFRHGSVVDLVTESVTSLSAGECDTGSKRVAPGLSDSRGGRMSSRVIFKPSKLEPSRACFIRSLVAMYDHSLLNELQCLSIKVESDQHPLAWPEPSLFYSNQFIEVDLIFADVPPHFVFLPSIRID